MTLKRAKSNKPCSESTAITVNKSRSTKPLHSEEVTQNLDQDLKDLRQRVEDTFHGAPAAVTAESRKTNSKAMQYEGYKGRR